MAVGRFASFHRIGLEPNLYFRYHAYSEGHYWAPNDGKQNEQLDILFDPPLNLSVPGKQQPN